MDDLSGHCRVRQGWRASMGHLAGSCNAWFSSYAGQLREGAACDFPVQAVGRIKDKEDQGSRRLNVAAYGWSGSPVCAVRSFCVSTASEKHDFSGSWRGCQVFGRLARGTCHSNAFCRLCYWLGDLFSYDCPEGQGMRDVYWRRNHDRNLYQRRGH